MSIHQQLQQVSGLGFYKATKLECCRRMWRKWCLNLENWSLLQVSCQLQSWGLVILPMLGIPSDDTYKRSRPCFVNAGRGCAGPEGRTQFGQSIAKNAEKPFTRRRVC